MSSTKERILAIARDLFARQGYTGTTIADIAGELGTTTAALYYHFRSKADILRGLLEQPMAAYLRILEGLREARPPAEELLGAFIDLTVDSRELSIIIDRDPTVLAMISEQLPISSAELMTEVIHALAGPDADHAAQVRAHAAFGVVKQATLAAMALTGPHQDGPRDGLAPADRAEILAAALRALGAVRS
jgi:AcrR family transcriptional regulator